jgi:hypothetical protein
MKNQIKTVDWMPKSRGYSPIAHQKTPRQRCFCLKTPIFGPLPTSGVCDFQIKRGLPAMFSGISDEEDISKNIVRFKAFKCVIGFSG